MQSMFTRTLVGTCLAVLALAPAAQATFPGNAGLIAFHSNRNGNYDIYTQSGANSSTTPTQLTTSAADDEVPAWSPDGFSIAFTSNRDGNFEIYKMGATGAAQTRLTNNAAQDTMPTWSPDGTKIAFVSNRDGNFEIYVMASDGSGVVRLTNNAANDSEPNWSPDGTKIAFQSNRTGNFDIYTMNPDGSNQTDLTNNSSYDETPNYTPGGSKIYFDTNTSGQWEINSMNTDGSNVTPLTSGAGSLDWNAAPSPGGLAPFAWQSNADGPDYDIWVQGLFSTFDLTQNSSDDGYPDWQPLNRDYFRPRGASPLRLSFVPAYKKCGDPNSATGFTHHRGSINTNACWEPRAESSYLQLGTPTFNGLGANSVGSAEFKVLPSANDVSVAVSYTDVRCQGISGGCSSGPPSDYTDDLYFDSTFRITDKGNGPYTTGPAVNGTVDDILLRFSVPCTATTSTTVGSTCSINTTINSLLGPTAIVAGQRAMWQLVGGVNLWDGGADGVASTMGDDTLFAATGFFVP